MPKPKLFYSPVSPPSRAVLITANLLGIQLERIVVDLFAGEHLTPEFLKMNPLHQIPVLVDGSATICDSHAICTYLIDKYGQQPQQDQLYPADLERRARVDARLHFDTGVLFARINVLYEEIIDNGCRVICPEKAAYIQKAWPLLEALLANNPYLCGDQLTVADVACIASVCSVDRIVLIDSAAYPRLVQWMEQLEKELPQYCQDCRAGGLLLQDFVKRALD